MAAAETGVCRATYHLDRVMRCISFAALVLWCSLISVAQVPEATGGAKAPARKAPPGNLHRISVKGNHLYSSEDVIRESGLKIGQRISASAIEEARKKLQDTELFTNVADEYRFTPGDPPNYELTFQVTENEQLFPMRFERLGASPDAIRQY